MSEPNDESRENGAAAHFGIDPKLLEILVCPLTKATLEYDADKQELISQTGAARLSDP